MNSEFYNYYAAKIMDHHFKNILKNLQDPRSAVASFAFACNGLNRISVADGEAKHYAIALYNEFDKMAELIMRLTGFKPDIFDADAKDAHKLKWSQEEIDSAFGDLFKKYNIK